MESIQGDVTYPYLLGFFFPFYVSSAIRQMCTSVERTNVVEVENFPSSHFYITCFCPKYNRKYHITLHRIKAVTDNNPLYFIILSNGRYCICNLIFV